jgi:4-cresol dehydrogenase (hydroxylating)
VLLQGELALHRWPIIDGSIRTSRRYTRALATTLPPGTSAAQLAQALEAFVDALGADAVLVSEEERADFRDPYAFAGWDDHAASAVVLPETVEEVQAIVRIANEQRVPLWTSSQGRNNAYGGPEPVVRGSVLVSLRRMNRVLEVNEELAYALVEPGVRFFDIHEHLRAGGYRLWSSMPDLGWGSLVGNTLDHGFGYTPYGDHVASQCGLEVVLANGDVLRTGMGAMTGTKTWQTYKRGFGPSADGLFMQSNFGIVTKMGVWLMPEPECFVSCRATVPDEDALAPLVETLRPLVLDRTIPNVPLIGHAMGAGAWGAARRDWFDGDGPFPEEAIERIIRERGVGRWNVRFALYGHERVVDAQLELVQEAFAAIDGAELKARKVAADDVPLEGAAGHADRAQRGIPSLDMLDMLGWWGGVGGHIDFSPVAPLTGEDAVALTRLLRPVVERHGFDYGPAFIITPRSLVHICPVIYNTLDEQQVHAAYRMYEELVAVTAPAGYGLYRGHVHFMDLVADTYDFGDGALRRFNQTIKDALDPNGILSPGKQGIWPSAPVWRDA